MLINQDDFKIDMGSRDGLQGAEHEDLVLRDEGNLAVW